MYFNFKGFDMQRHYPQVFPRASSSSSLNYAYIPGHDTNDARGTFIEDQLMEIHREIEKERIREEIIAAEIERQRVLEAEVRRELIIEREMMALQSGGGYCSPSMLETPRRTHYHHHHHHHPFNTETLHGEWFTPYDSRRATSFPEIYGRGGSEIGGFEAAPFRGRSLSPIVNETTSYKPKDGKAGIIGLGKPYGVTISGSNRQAGPSSSPPAVLGSSGGSSNTPKKKIKEKFDCMVCGITASSERDLSRHLSGKKHQAQMEASKAHNNNGSDIGFGKIKKQSSNTCKSGATVSGSKREAGLSPSPPAILGSSGGTSSKKKLKEEWKCMVCGISAPSERGLNDHLSGKKHQAQIKKQPSNTENSCKTVPVHDLKEDKKITGEEGMSKKFRFWCSMCQAGAEDEKIMRSHKNGKKHLKNLLKKARGET